MDFHTISLITLFIASIFEGIRASDRWPNHDISTLKLLTLMQIHGDKAPLKFPPNDPFQTDKYWPTGTGELLPKGKYRLYKRGQFIREEYDQFLTRDPREVFVRSAQSDQCLESVACLLSGAYPVTDPTWKWSNGTDAEIGNYWQPLPIYTFMPNQDDLVLEAYKPCPVAERAAERIHNRCPVKTFFDEHKPLLDQLKNITGKTDIDNVYGIAELLDTLSVETDMGYIWSNVWNAEQQKHIVKQLKPGDDLYWNYEWDSPAIKRLRAGGFVRELRENFQNMIDGKRDKKKLLVYATHGSQLALVMSAINVFNRLAPTYGATLLWELHLRNGTDSSPEDWFVKAYYHNETDIDSDIPHSLEWKDCGGKTECPIQEFLQSTQHLLYEDFDKECNR